MTNTKPSISFVSNFSGNADDLIYANEGGRVLILPLRDNVLFPGTICPVLIGRKSSLKVVREAHKKGTFIGVFTQKSPETEEPTREDMYPVGVMARVVHVVDASDNTESALLHIYNTIKLKSLELGPKGYEGDVEAFTDVPPTGSLNEDRYNAVLDLCKAKSLELAEYTGNVPRDIIKFIENLSPCSFLANLLCNNLPVNVETKINLLMKHEELDRAEELLKVLIRVVQMAEIKRTVELKTQSDLDRQQREYFISQEIKNLQAELDKGNGNYDYDDISQLRETARKINWDEKVKAFFDKELNKLSHINPQSADYNVQLNYLQTLVSLPWNKYTKSSIKLDTAERILNRDHYGMEKVKERILEHLAVLKLRTDQKSPIICLYGPPGVGKTSLGKSIAQALKRNYVRISLGGVHDESEIRGHRRTYIGSMPGRIIKGLIKADSSNPVFILDEIDKISSNNINGDPSSAMLEVLDPEQNEAFHDNYLDVDYDLSKVMFIATANDISSIPRPLLDRMELIEVNGYITEEKIEIANRHLVPNKIKANGISNKVDIKINKAALEFIIEKYTRESGVRELEKRIDKIFRKVALLLARNKDVPKTITPKEVEEMLGKPLYNRDIYQGNGFAGVVTGLAWTSVGGEILFIETSLSKGKGGRLTLTGNLGDVMKESAMLAVEYIKAHADHLGINPKIFDNYNIHIHVPEGAVPKDGPSAGITMATSIASAMTQRKVRQRLAMTGEITLRGKVLPVGGIKEKILAAKRAGITTIMLCEENQKDIEEIPQLYLKGLEFRYVRTIQDVLDFALLEEKASQTITFTFDEEKKSQEEK